MFIRLLRGNISVPDWKLRTSFKIFLSKKIFFNEIWPKDCIALALIFVVIFLNGGYDVFLSKPHFSNQLASEVKQFLSNRLEVVHTSLLLDYLVKYVQVFWYRKNCPTYCQLFTFFCWKIQTSILNLHKFINIQYF